METFHSSDETLRDSDATLREPALPVPLTAQGVMEHVRKILASRRSKPRQRRPVLEHLFESLEERRMLSIAPIAAEVSTMEAAAWNLSQEHEFRWLGGPDIDPQGNKYFKDKDFIYWIMTPSGELYFEQMYPGGLRGRFTSDYYDRIEEMLFNAPQPSPNEPNEPKEPTQVIQATDAVLAEESTTPSHVVETLSAAGGGENVTLSGEPIVVTETYDPGHPTRGHWTEYVLLKPGAGDSVTYRVSAKGRLELFLTSPDYPDRDPETEVRIFDGGKLIASVRVDMSKRATDETFDLPGGRKVPGYRLGEFDFQSEPAVSVESSRTGLWRGAGNLVVKQKENTPKEPKEPNEPPLLTIPTELQQHAYDLKEQYHFTLDRSGIHDDPFGRVVGKTRDDAWVHTKPDGKLFVSYEAVANLSPEYYTHALELLIKAASPQSEKVDLTPAPAPTEFPTLESEGPRESLRAFALQVTGMEKSSLDLRAIARRFNPQYFAEEPWKDHEMFEATALQGENHTWAVEGMIGMQLEFLNDVQRGINAWNTMVAGALVEAYYAELRQKLGMEPLREDFVGFNLSGGVNRDAARAEKYVGLPHRSLIETMAAAYFPEIHRKHLELAGHEVASRTNTEAKNGNGYSQPHPSAGAVQRSEAAIEQHLRVLREAHAADAAAYARAVDAYMASIGRDMQDLFSVDDVIVRREEIAAPGVNDVVGVWTTTFPRYYEILSPDTIAQIEADVAKYDPAKPLIVIFLGSNQRVEPGVDEESPGLLRLARRFSNEGIQVKVFTTGSNPTDLSNGRYDANVIPMGGDVPAKPYAERWLETFYQNVKIPGGIFTVGYSHGASRQVTVLNALLTKYPEVPILGSVNLDGVNDPFSGFPFWKSETEAPQNTQVHLDILEEAGSVWSFTVPYLNEEITLHVRTIRGAAARNMAPDIEHHILDIQNATHSDMDDHPAVHDTIYTFVHRALENAK